MKLKDLVLGLYSVDRSIIFGGSFSAIRQGVNLGRYPHDLDVFVNNRFRLFECKNFLYSKGFHEVLIEDDYERDASVVMQTDLGFKVEFFEIKEGTITVDDPEYSIKLCESLEYPVKLVSLYDIIKWKLTYIDGCNEKQAYKCLRDIQTITSHVYNSRKVN